jgi:hypothetical protein
MKLEWKGLFLKAKTPQNEHFGEMLFICNFKFEPPAAGIEEACPQGRKGIGPRGAEATLGAPATPLAQALTAADKP